MCAKLESSAHKEGVGLGDGLDVGSKAEDQRPHPGSGGDEQLAKV
jgi:hypothetical protein